MQTGDDQVVAQFALNAFAASTDVGDRLLTQAWDQKSRAHARTLCRLWAAKGYQVVYLSGRQVHTPHFTDCCFRLSGSMANHSSSASIV